MMNKRPKYILKTNNLLKSSKISTKSKQKFKFPKQVNFLLPIDPPVLVF